MEIIRILTATDERGLSTDSFAYWQNRGEKKKKTTKSWLPAFGLILPVVCPKLSNLKTYFYFKMEVMCTKLDLSVGLGMWNIPAVSLLCFSTMEAEKILQTNFIIAAFMWDMKAH